MHRDPRPGFYVRQGFYQPQCRRQPVPRFECSRCGKGFSRQTFRADFRDRKPELNAPLLRLLANGVSLRQSGRRLGLGVHAVQAKFRKLSRLLSLRSRVPDVRRLDPLHIDPAIDGQPATLNSAHG
jgi:transposase-like protein